MVDIDGDGSFLMNCQELATAKIEQLEVKTFILNNQHLGMVVQWEDRFYKANRAHTYLGHRVRSFSYIPERCPKTERRLRSSKMQNLASNLDSNASKGRSASPSLRM